MCAVTLLCRQHKCQNVDDNWCFETFLSPSDPLHENSRLLSMFLLSLGLLAQHPVVTSAESGRLLFQKKCGAATAKTPRAARARLDDWNLAARWN
jgi:hypothetical protein